MADYDPDRLLSERPSGTPTMTVRPRSREEAEKVVRKYNPDITNAAVQGELDNIQRESGFNSNNNTGDHGTSGGAYQHHNERLTNLKAFAQKEGKPWTDFETQVKFSRLEKERDYPKLLAFQQTNNDRNANEEAFKRIFERPASVLWQNNNEGRPVTESDRFKFSDYAMKEFMDKPGHDIRFMDPAEYLQLTPPLEGKPFSSPSGRSLKKSFDQGDQIEQIPSLDVSVNGPTAQVTDQDGRHRALLAQENGIQAIPVAIKQTGKGDPKEIVGMDGVPQAFDHPRQPRQEAPEQPKAPISLLRQIGDAIIPGAHAAEPGLPEWMKGSVPVEASNAGGEIPDWMKGSEPVQSPSTQAAPPQAPPQGMAGKVGGAIADAAVSAMVPGAGLIRPHLGSEIINPDNAAAVTRGVAPYAAGAGIGAGLGAMAGGVGAIPGAVAGAGAVGLSQLATGLSGLPGPEKATNALLDRLGVRPSATPEQRVIEQMTSGAANAFTGAEAMKLLAATMRTPASKAAVNYLMNKSGSVGDTVRSVAGELAKSPGLQTMAGAFSGAASQLAAEAGLPQSMQTLVGMAAGLIPGGKGMVPNWRHIDASPAAKKAIEAGFAIPPAEASEGHIGKFNASNALAAEGGKIKTQQLASAQNQIVVDRKAAQELALPPDTTLFPDTLKQVRAREGQVFQEVERAVPEVSLSTNPVFKDTVNEIGKPSASTERLFPSTKEPPGILELRAELLKHARAPTGDVLRYIADLRSRATAGFQAHGEGAAMAHRMAFAEREAANALEDAIEDSVKNAPQYYRAKLSEAQKARDDQYRERAAQDLPLQGEMIEQADAAVQNWSDKLANANAKNQNNQTLLDRLRDARRMMAKSYDIEAVTNPSNGHVSATGLGRLKQRGSPLTGQLEEIADAANNFRKAFQNPSAFGGVEPLSVLDMAFVGGNAAKALAHAGTGNLWGALSHAAAAIPPILRPFSRAAQLSPENQAKMIAPRGNVGTAPLGGLTGAMLPTQPVPGNPGGNALLGLATTQ